MSKGSKPVVSMADFVRVVRDRENFPTHEDAASELGMTVGSFKQRLTRERKRYPKQFESVPGYRVAGSRIMPESEVAAIFESFEDDNSESSES